MKFELIITMNDGQIGISGPIDNKLVSYGLLELAKEAIQQHHANNARLIQPASGPLPGGPMVGPFGK